MNAEELSRQMAEAFADAGATKMFGVPGGGNNLDLIGAAEAAGIDFVLVHAETPAAIMASVYGDLTASPPICVVTRGPGAACAVNGVANALLDRQRLVIVTDTVSAADQERIAHQQLDQRGLFRTVTKWSATVGQGSVDETLAHGLATASQPPMGPVHIDFDPTAESTAPLAELPPDAVNPAELERALELLASASRPVIIFGVGARGLHDEVRAQMADSNAPMLLTYRAKGLIPDSWPSNAGLMTAATAEAPVLDAADLIVMIGVDTVEFIPASWPYSAPVVSFNAWREAATYLPFAAEVVGDLSSLLARVAPYARATSWPSAAGNSYRDAELERLVAAGSAPVDGLAPQTVVQRVRACSQPRTIATVDAGAHMLPAMAFWDAEAVDEILISSGLATMGFSLPAAIGAALARPGRRVVAFTGDGGLGMCLGELETLKRLSLPVTVVVFNDARLSLIEIKAKPTGNGGEGAVRYARTDFAHVAQGYGLTAATASSVSELDAAVRAVEATGGPGLIDVEVDPSAYPQILDAVRGKRKLPATT